MDDDNEGNGHSQKAAQQLDQDDPLAKFRLDFAIPTNQAINATDIPSDQGTRLGPPLTVF
jgi:hypothetical protein